MRRTIFLLLSIIPLGIAAQEQDYKPLLRPGRVWNYTETVHYMFYEEYPQDIPDEFERTFTVTVIGEDDDGNGVMLCKAYDNNGVEEALSIKDSYFQLIEKDKGVYGLWKPYGTDIELYTLLDFNLKQGDKFNLMYEYEQGAERLVVEEDSICVKDRKYRRLAVGTAEGKVLDYWVEGIGSKNSLYVTQLPAITMISNGGVSHYYSTDTKLVSVYDNDECIFECEDFCQKPYTTQVSMVEKNPAIPQTYDPQGRKLAKKNLNSPFIEDGKVRVVR